MSEISPVDHGNPEQLAAISEADRLQEQQQPHGAESLSPALAVSSLPLTGESVVFTGTLASMVHREAFRLVEQSGGRASQSVSSATTMLVLGEEGWPLEPDGEMSQKLRQIMQMMADGFDVKVIAESDWLQLLGLDERRDEIRRACTPAMLSRMLNIPVRLIRRWARLGLIRPVRRVCRLPYFDYREVASARRLADLLDQGVSPQMLERSLMELSRTVAGTDRSLAQLNLLVRDNTVLIRDERGVLNPRTGQRLLDFDTVGTGGDAILSSEQGDSQEDFPVSVPFSAVQASREDRQMADWNAEEWFHEACRLTEESEFEAAINAFRNSLSLLRSEQQTGSLSTASDNDSSEFPDPADAHFHLADALYRAGKPDAAIERYYCAIESAPDFVEAWTQLGCIEAELGQFEAAEQSLLTAISIHAANPDALLHYAQLLDQTERRAEAASYWKKYLQYDIRGPWSDLARQRIAEFVSENSPQN